jgi:hypothetical protein
MLGSISIWLAKLYNSYIFRIGTMRFPCQWGALIRLEKTENGAKQNSAVKTKWLLIVFWGPPNNIIFFSFNFVCL